MKNIEKALIRLHDIVSEIVECGLLTVGDGENVVSTKQYQELLDALFDSNAALDELPRR